MMDCLIAMTLIVGFMVGVELYQLKPVENASMVKITMGTVWPIVRMMIVLRILGHSGDAPITLDH
jgi:hypothetical protein